MLYRTGTGKIIDNEKLNNMSPLEIEEAGISYYEDYQEYN